MVNSLFKKFIEYARFVLSKIKKNLEKSDCRALFILALVGFFVAVSWWRNATLVYDDVILTKDSESFGFQYIVARDGWFRALLHYLVLDLPDQYRTFGFSRAFQFLLWTFGVASASSYSLIISLLQVLSALAFYSTLQRLKFDRLFALLAGLIWLMSSFVWTSCFHHYSYTILPFQLAIIGAYFLIRFFKSKKIDLIAILLGAMVGLTGELHLIAAPLVFIGIAVTVKRKSVFRSAILTVLSMFLAVLIHYSIWRIFEADMSLRHRFALNSSDSFEYWITLTAAALKSVCLSFSEPLIQLAVGNGFWLILATSIFMLVFLNIFLWVERGSSKAQDNGSERNRWIFPFFLLVIASSYFLIFILVGILSNIIPTVMPRRYGAVPWTLVSIAVCLLLVLGISNRLYKQILASLFIGFVAALFVLHQWFLIPQIRQTNGSLSETIMKKKGAGKGVLFFNASSLEFPRANIYPDSAGPSMQDSVGAELTQSIYGTYWPAEMQMTRIFGAPFACEIVASLDNEKLKIACPYGKVYKEIKADDAIVVANLGFDKSDPFGRSVKVFKKFDDFKPYFFSRMIITDEDTSLKPKGDFFSINLDETLPKMENTTIFPNKEFETQLVLDSGSWLKNYGWTNQKSNNSELEYAFDFLESDLNIYLDFEGSFEKQVDKKFEVQISWNEGKWVSLGKIDPTQMNNGQPFSIRLSNFSVKKFQFRVLSNLENKNSQPIKSVFVERKPVAEL